VTPLGTVTLVCLLAFFDLRLQGLDLLLDPLGWLLGIALAALGTAAVLLGALLSGADDLGDLLGPGVLLLVVGLTDLALVLWLVVVLFLARREPWAQAVRAAPPAAAAPSGG
jgi:hypothetical protein